MFRILILAGASALCLVACGPRGEVARGDAAAPRAGDESVTGVAAEVGASAVGEISTVQFIEDAAETDLYAVEAAELALARSRAPEVRHIAQAIADDALASSGRLRPLSNGAVLPTALDARRRAALADLRQARDDQFDARYLDQQTIAHHEALLLMSGYRAVGDLPPLKAYAAEVEPRLRARLDEIVALSDILPES
jgi:putative membrane protein